MLTTGAGGLIRHAHPHRHVEMGVIHTHLHAHRTGQPAQGIAFDDPRHNDTRHGHARDHMDLLADLEQRQRQDRSDGAPTTTQAVERLTAALDGIARAIGRLTQTQDGPMCPICGDAMAGLSRSEIVYHMIKHHWEPVAEEASNGGPAR